MKNSTKLVKNFHIKEKSSTFIAEMEISNAKIKIFSSLALKKHRKEHGLFMVEGAKCVLDTIGSFKVEAIVATSNWHDSHNMNLPEEKLLTASMRQMSRISSLSTPPDVVAICHLPDWSLDENMIHSELTLMLDGIQDPGNLGTIIRIADWFGIHQIIASHDTVDLFNPKTIQATMGALSRVKVIYADLCGLLSQMENVPVYGTMLDGDNLYSKELSQTGIIVMGNEGKGVSTPVKKYVTEKLFIPPYPGDAPTSESLNVGVATAITVSEFRRRAK